MLFYIGYFLACMYMCKWPSIGNIAMTWPDHLMLPPGLQLDLFIDNLNYCSCYLLMLFVVLTVNWQYYFSFFPQNNACSKI